MRSRWSLRDAIRGPSFAWPGARIPANFDGTEISVTLDELVTAGCLVVRSGMGPRDRWRVEAQVRARHRAKNKYTLRQRPSCRPSSRGGPSSRSEAQNGVTQFLGLDFGAGKLLPPPPAAARALIEVVGDLDACRLAACRGAPLIGVPTVRRRAGRLTGRTSTEGVQRSARRHLLLPTCVGTAYSGKRGPCSVNANLAGQVDDDSSNLPVDEPALIRRHLPDFSFLGRSDPRDHQWRGRTTTRSASRTRRRDLRPSTSSSPKLERPRREHPLATSPNTHVL